MIKELHWLPILARVRYKVLLLVAKSQQGLAPRYLCELMSKPLSARSSRPLRSADCCIFLYLGPVLLHPRTGHLQLWALRFGLILLLHSGVWCFREYHRRPYVV